MELTHPDAPSEVRAWAEAPPVWLRVLNVSHVDRTLPAALGLGERAAISLALGQSADLLLIDDQAGRRQAELRHITSEGTLALLLKAALRNHVDLAVSLARLRQFGFRASAPVVEAMLDRYKRARARDSAT